MKHLSPAAFLLSLLLATPTIAADKNPKPSPTPPSTLPPTSRMLVVPQPGAASTDGQQPAKLISSDMSGRDLGFLMKTVEAGREQAFFVDLLKKNASSGRLKTLADTLSTAQAEENGHIARLATQKGLNVSLEPTAAEKKAAEALTKLSGSNFDKAVMDKVVAANNQALAAYQDAAQSADPQIKSFAGQMLPLAEEKRHIVEKMTGAGSKTGNPLFDHGGASEGPPVATPAAKPVDKGTPAPSIKSTPSASPKAKPTPAGKSTPAAATSLPPLPRKSTPAAATSLPPLPRKSTPAAATATPPESEKSTPAATPTQSAILALPVATPPGQGATAPLLPPIVPPKVPPTPVPVK